MHAPASSTVVTHHAWLKRHSLYDAFAAISVFAFGLALYIATLAPTVTWGDDATLQLAAVLGRLQASAGSHPAWVALAHLFSHLPFSEPAYGVNLTSAFGAAVTLVLLFLIMRRLHVPCLAALLAVAAFAVTHTFWAHAVRAEVYTLTLATMALPVWALLVWRDSGRARFLILLGASIGLALSTHVLALLYVPGLAWLLLRERSRIGPREAVVLLASVVLSLAPLGYLLWRDARSLGLDLPGALRWALFTFQGYDFAAQMLHFSPGGWLQALRYWLMYLVYQFVGAGFLLALLGVWLSRRRLSVTDSVFVGLLYLAPALFAFTYQVGDQYVFFLPTYLPFAIWLALGIAAVQEWLAGRPVNKALATTSLALLLVLVPVGLYRLTPEVMQRFGLQFRDARYVPGEQGRLFVLWPPKNGYYDAREYAEAALNDAPPQALLLADPILASPIAYIQHLEGRRPDVSLKFCCWSIDEELHASGDRPVLLADVAPAIYPTERISQEFSIVPKGVLYLLVKRVPGHAES